MLKVCSIERLFDNWMYVINPQNDDFNYFLFDGDQMLTNRQQMYCINCYIIKRLNNGLIVEVHMNRM